MEDDDGLQEARVDKEKDNCGDTTEELLRTVGSDI